MSTNIILLDTIITNTLVVSLSGGDPTMMELRWEGGGRNAAVEQQRNEEIGRQYISLLSEPRSAETIRSEIDMLVAGDHITHCTSWGTLLGREALKNFVVTSQKAFPVLSYHIDSVASSHSMVYCQWSVANKHVEESSDTSGVEPSPEKNTMAVRIPNDIITETWRPCDPWLPLWSEMSVVPPNRTDL